MSIYWGASGNTSARIIAKRERDQRMTKILKI